MVRINADLLSNELGETEVKYELHFKTFFQQNSF